MQHRHPKGNSGLGCKVKLDEDTGKLNTSFRKIVCKIGVLVPGISTLPSVRFTKRRIPILQQSLQKQQSSIKSRPLIKLISIRSSWKQHKEGYAESLGG